MLLIAFSIELNGEQISFFPVPIVAPLFHPYAEYTCDRFLAQFSSQIEEDNVLANLQQKITTNS